MSKYLDNSKNQSMTIKILVGVIVLQMLINVGMFKSLLDIAGDKTFKFEVPSFLESGEYRIGTTFSNKKVYKMWSKIWVEEMSNFSPEDVREKTKNIIEFLNPETAYENKAKILKFVDFVEENYITQSFDIVDHEIVETDKKGYIKIKWTGRLNRKIGLKADPLNGLKYTYSFTCFTRNGQVYIHDLSLDMTEQGQVKVKKKLEANEFVNFEEYVNNGKKKESKND